MHVDCRSQVEAGRTAPREEAACACAPRAGRLFAVPLPEAFLRTARDFFRSAVRSFSAAAAMASQPFDALTPASATARKCLPRTPCAAFAARFTVCRAACLVARA